jgi:hypothetical protein
MAATDTDTTRGQDHGTHLFEGELLVLHEVGQHNGRRTGHAHRAVHQHGLQPGKEAREEMKAAAVE